MLVNFFVGNLDFPKFKKLKNVMLMFEPALNCENVAIFKQNHSLALFIAF